MNIRDIQYSELVNRKIKKNNEFRND